MRSHRYRKWRPLAGVVALGLFAFGWSLQGAADEREQPKVQAGARVTAVVSTSDESAPATTGCGSGGVSADRSIIEEGITGILTRAIMPVTGDVPVFGATKFGKKSSGVAGRGRTDCICDSDCDADGSPCTHDWCDLSGTTPPDIVGVCVQDYDNTEGLDCEDGGDFCTMGACDGAGVCVEDAGGSPCDPGYCADDPAVECYVDLDCDTGVCEDEEVCNETDARCEDQECHDDPGNPNACNDGKYCNGEELCDAENQCITGDDPCPAACGIDGCYEDGHCANAPDISCTVEGTGAPCDVGVACIGACQDDGTDCATDADCGGAVGSCIFEHGCGAVDIGRCCSGPPLFETCDDTLTLAECDAVPGLWDCEGGCGYCQGDPFDTVCHNDLECDWDTVPCVIVGCPPYSSGWAPQGDIVWDVGPIENQPCADYYRVGDDYTLANGLYTGVTKFSFVGGVEEAPATVVFEFWDDSEPPVEVNSFGLTCNTSGNYWRTVAFTHPILIPPVGYVTMRMAEDDLGAAHWLSTDVVDIGDNNAQVLWVNDVCGPHLSPDHSDILVFEMIGIEDENEGQYACCDALTGACTLETPWDCEAAENTSLYLDGEASCDPNPCQDGACCLDDGRCIITIGPTACTLSDGVWDEFGTDCEPNCCPQPEPYSGDDDCDGAMAKATQIQVPTYTEVCESDDDCNPGEHCIGEVGVGIDSMCTVQITISGDNTDATFGDCSPTDDRGWYEAFNLVDGEGEPAECARVTIDECCTFDELGEVPGSGYIILFRGCSESSDPLNCGVSVGADDYGRAPFCGPGDNNIWTIWEAIPGGSYHYPIVSSAAGESEDYPDSTLFPYQAHISVTACPLFACCIPPLDEGTPEVRCAVVDCFELNRVACDAVDGWFNQDVPYCQYGPDPPGTCDLGACCESPGVCNDLSGMGMSCVDCLSFGEDAVYFGGASCKKDHPCPVCPWYSDTAGANPDYCIWDELGRWMFYCDRSSGTPYPRLADDFIASSTGVIERICWWPGFVDVTNDIECSDDPAGHPQGGIDDDAWQVVIYDNLDPTYTFDIGIPGNAIFGPTTVDVDAQSERGGISRVWEYSAPLVGGPFVTEGECYWLEVTGMGAVGGCNIFWMSSGAGNWYSVRDGTGEWGPEDIRMDDGDTPIPGRFVDLTFCVSIGMAGSCGDIPGACIVCGEEGPECSSTATDHELCHAEKGVKFYPYMNCNSGYCDDGTWCTVGGAPCLDGGPCTSILPPPPDGDSCVLNPIHIHDGQPGDLCPTLPCTIEFTNVCATRDGFKNVTPCGVIWNDVGDERWACPPPGGCYYDDVEFGTDTWYQFHVDEGQCGELLLDFCTGYTYDGIVAVYGIPAIGADSPDDCPLNSNEGLVACGDDLCGSFEGMPLLPFRATEEWQNHIHVCGGKNYLLRVAGWEGGQGRGQMYIDFQPGVQVCDDGDKVGEHCTHDDDCPGAGASCVWSDVCEDDPTVLCVTDQDCIDAGAGYVCTPCDPRFCEIQIAKRPMAEDCRDIPPGTRCDTGKEDACAIDEDCANESHCVPPPDEGLCNDEITECSVSEQDCPAGLEPCEPKFEAVCYAPKMRYLSIARNPEQLPNTARRVKLQDGACQDVLDFRCVTDQDCEDAGAVGPCISAGYCVDGPGVRCVTEQNCIDHMWCEDDHSIACLTNTDCTDAGATGPCVAAELLGPCIPDVVLGWLGMPTEDKAAGLWLAEIVSENNRVYKDQWPDVVHVWGCEIAHACLSNVTEKHCNPNPIVDETCVQHCYIVQAISDAGDTDIEDEYSDELMLCTNSYWGDMCGIGAGGLRTPPDAVYNLADILAAIGYFQGDTGIAPVTWLDIAPSFGTGVPDQTISLADISGFVSGFQGSPYPGKGPKGNCN